VTRLASHTIVIGKQFMIRYLFITIHIPSAGFLFTLLFGEPKLIWSLCYLTGTVKMAHEVWK